MSPLDLEHAPTRSKREPMYIVIRYGEDRPRRYGPFASRELADRVALWAAQKHMADVLVERA